MTTISEDRIKELAHRTCARYRCQDAWPYQFNNATLIDFARKIEAAAREKYSADTARIDFLEKNNPGRFGDISGPDVFAVMFRLVEPPRETLREAIDAAMAAESTT